jgi:hypothetical protein
MPVDGQINRGGVTKRPPPLAGEGDREAVERAFRSNAL